MSVSLAVAARPGHVARVPSLSSPPWATPPVPQRPDGRDLNRPDGLDLNRPDGLDLSGVVLHIVADRQIYAEGDEAKSFYKVVSGVVRICRFLSDGRRQIDAFQMTGDVFGFEAGSEHRMSAEAVSDCTVIAYRRRGLEAMIGQDEKLSRWFFSHAISTMASTREHSLLLGRASAAQKISAFLLEAAGRKGNDTVVDLAMSRQDIADYLGLTIETVSRTLSQLERDGTISLPSARRVVLKDRRSLRVLNS
jgi:CRP/FNR family nitrogen fixation transcriptional regulator